MEQSQHNRTQWTSQRRRAFIEHRLYWVGQLGLPDLMGAFDLSRAQASKEINAYKRDHPDNIVYDPHAKTYVMGTTFIPQYETPDSSLYLNDLMGISRGACIQNAERYALIPDIFAPPIPSRGVKPETLRPILRAIDAKKRLKITYQSMSADEPKERSISPHALCFDGFRWHCRAFCFSADDFRDFVISRILEVQQLERRMHELETRLKGLEGQVKTTREAVQARQAIDEFTALQQALNHQRGRDVTQ